MLKEYTIAIYAGDSTAHHQTAPGVSFPRQGVCFFIRSRRPEARLHSSHCDEQLVELLEVAALEAVWRDGGIRLALYHRRRRGSLCPRRTRRR
jgi:hypothetical protein